VTFLWQGNDQTRNVAIFDGVAGFDAKDQMLHLDRSDVWYKTYRVRNGQLGAGLESSYSLFALERSRLGWVPFP
jgi:hypothetical protein